MSSRALTLILCTFNRVNQLSGALDAILFQDAGPEQIIIVDDASTDGTAALLTTIASRHPNVTTLRNDINVGPELSANLALSAATGDYVAWCADDDRLLPGFFARVRSVLDEAPTIGVIAAEIRFHGENVIGAETAYQFEGIEGGRALSPADYVQACLDAYLWLPGYATFLRRDALLEAGGWRVEFAWLSDWFGVLVAALRSGAYLIPEPFANVKKDDTSHSSRGFADPVRTALVLDQVLAVLSEPQFEDIRCFVRAAPLTLLTPLGPSILRRLAVSPRNWDLLFPMMRKKLELSIGHRLRF